MTSTIQTLTLGLVFNAPFKKKNKATKDYQTNKQINSIEEKFSLKNHHKMMNIITMRQGQYAIKKAVGGNIHNFS